MTMPREAYDIALAVWERFHEECIALHPDNTEEQARELTKRINQQLEFSFPGEGYCWKSSTPTNPPSKDVAARVVLNSFFGWDLYFAAGANGPKFFNPYPPPEHDLAGQHPIQVEGKNWLEINPVPPIQPPVVLLMEYASVVRRSDPKGFLMPFEASSPFPIKRVELFMDGDGEPSIQIDFIPENKRDGRYCRALAWKPVVNGDWIPVVRAWDINGLMGEARGSHAVTVTL